MNATFWAGVARRLLSRNLTGGDSGISLGNRRLIASVLFQLARLSGELRTESIDLWLKAVAGKMNGFSQIRLLDECRAFVAAEASAFRLLLAGDADLIFTALSKFDCGSDPYREILKATLFIVAIESSDGRTTGLQSRLAAEKSFDRADESAIEFLGDELRAAVNAEIGDRAFRQLSSENHQRFSLAPVKSTIVEVVN